MKKLTIKNQFQYWFSNLLYSVESISNIFKYSSHTDMSIQSFSRQYMKYEKTHREENESDWTKAEVTDDKNE